jgi:hydrogenase-4 membrane subunit HyfE
VVELGVALDLIVVLTVAAAFHSRIFSEFGTGDTKHLRTLRD